MNKLFLILILGIFLMNFVSSASWTTDLETKLFNYWGMNSGDTNV